MLAEGIERLAVVISRMLKEEGGADQSAHDATKATGDTQNFW
jgi:hypothetical protein